MGSVSLSQNSQEFGTDYTGATRAGDNAGSVWG
jgi:hypothetical protein